MIARAASSENMTGELAAASGACWPQRRERDGDHADNPIEDCSIGRAAIEIVEIAALPSVSNYCGYQAVEPERLDPAAASGT